MLFDTIYYHSKCWDGVCSAWVYQKYHKLHSSEEVKFISVAYGDSVNQEDIKHKNILILDFSFRDPSILSECKSALLLDHHLSALSINMKNKIVDPSRSGCQIAYNYFFPDEKEPDIISYISDRDLWTWNLPFSKEINEYILSMPIALESIQTLFENWSTTKYSSIGKSLLEEKMVQIQNTVHMDEIFEGYHVKSARCSRELVSDTGNFLIKKYPNIDFVVIRHGNSVSLRGNGKHDLSKIAEKFGGGGHFNAAGYSL